MTIDEAREILLKVKGKILLHFESCHAEGFLEGWNARGKKDAEKVRLIHTNSCGFGCCTEDECSCTINKLRSVLDEEILKLSVLSEGEEEK